MLFCARYLEILLYQPSIQMISMSMAESERFPEQAANYFDVVFTEVHERLSVYLETTFAISPQTSSEASHRLLGRVIHPRLIRALFGIDPLAASLDQKAIDPGSDLQLRQAVSALLADLPTDRASASNA